MIAVDILRAVLETPAAQALSLDSDTDRAQLLALVELAEASRRSAAGPAVTTPRRC